jgi:hypothetical protein
MARMGFLFLIVVGLLAMILVARLASKTTKKEEAASPSTGYSKYKKMDVALQRGLISLLLKKKIIEEGELLDEINRIKNSEGLD